MADPALLLWTLCALVQTISSLPASTPTGTSPVLHVYPRFLHFSVWVQRQWQQHLDRKIVAVLESGHPEEKEHWQLLLHLVPGVPSQKYASTKLLSAHHQGFPPAVQLEGLEQCKINWEAENDDGQQWTIVEMEMELSPLFVFVRARNAVKYSLPAPLTDNADLRIYFVRIDQQQQTVCQLKSEMETKQTSKFALPPTSPHPAPAPAQPSAALEPEVHHPPFAHSTAPPAPIPKLAYKRKKAKIPRRSTAAAQRLLSPAHYVPSGGPSRRFLQHQQKAHIPAGVSSVHIQLATSTAAPSFIDLIRDKELYAQVQRSRTNEINSRWSPAFLAFVMLIGAMISATGAFALLMFVVLQCRPKAERQEQAA